MEGNVGSGPLATSERAKGNGRAGEGREWDEQTGMWDCEVEVDGARAQRSRRMSKSGLREEGAALGVVAGGRFTVGSFGFGVVEGGTDAAAEGVALATEAEAGPGAPTAPTDAVAAVGVPVIVPAPVPVPVPPVVAVVSWEAGDGVAGGDGSSVVLSCP